VGNDRAGEFDVIHLKDGGSYVARAIMYLNDDPDSRIIRYERWIMLLDGRSTEGVLNALEDLWNEVIKRYPEDLVGKSIQPLALWPSLNVYSGMSFRAWAYEAVVRIP
jgi:hypothetical protein